MKKGVIFINTARGKVVNTEDLIDALQNGNIHAAVWMFVKTRKNILPQPHRQKQ
jgi:D-lactate dehydrogenase